MGKAYTSDSERVITIDFDSDVQVVGGTERFFIQFGNTENVGLNFCGGSFESVVYSPAVGMVDLQRS